MKRFFEHKTAVFLVSVTLAAAIIIGIFAALSSSGRTSVSENVLETAAMPGQEAASGIGGWLNNIFSYFGSVKALREENEALKLENVELDKQLRSVRGMEQENEQLREMLDLMKTENNMELKAVKVISKDPSNWYSSFIINKGSNDGIEKDQPVITANEELVGKIVRVGSDWAEVMTILDPESGVGCIIERSKCTGVIEGDFSLRYTVSCKLGYLPRDTDIEKGDYVETSGMGGVYPKGLLVGKVSDIKEDNANMSKYAIIEPAADIGSLMQMLVVTNNVESVKRKTDTGSGLSDNNGDKESGSSSGNTNNSDDSSYSERKSTSSEASQTAKPTTKPSAKPSEKQPAGSGSGSNSGSANNSNEKQNSGSSAMNSLDGSELEE